MLRLIADAVAGAGGEAVMTAVDHANGTSRIDEAVRKIDPDGAFGVVVNVQGDLPTIEPAAIRAALAPFDEADVDIATVAAEIVSLK